MAGCRDTLREAAQWHQLLREGRAHLAAGELAQVGGLCVCTCVYVYVYV